jgi:hypothetical protein
MDWRLLYATYYLFIFIVYRMGNTYLGVSPDWKEVGRLISNRPRFPIGWIPASVMKKPAKLVKIVKLEDYRRPPPKFF